MTLSRVMPVDLVLGGGMLEPIRKKSFLKKSVSDHLSFHTPFPPGRNLQLHFVLSLARRAPSTHEAPEEKNRRYFCSGPYIVTSYSADFAPAWPSSLYSLSKCRVINTHRLPSRPISLLCLIVSEIEEITECDLCTNKIMSGPWQSAP